MISRNKTSLIFTLTVLTFLLLASSAIAAIEVTSDDLIMTVDYGELDDDEDELEISHQITVKNNGENTESLTFSLEGLDSDYDLTVTENLELSAGESEVITIYGTIPVDVDQGEHDIGTLKITGASEGEITKTLKTDVQSMLELKRLYVYINGQKEANINSNNDDVGGIEPGDEIELRFDLKNLFDDEYREGDIYGEISITLDDSDFGDGVDEEESFNIDADEELDEEIVLNFVVPDDAEDGEYVLEIVVEGEDENGAEYETNWELTLDIERMKNDVRIESANLAPATVSCAGNTKLVVEVVNHGSDRQKNAALSVYNQKLDLDVRYDFVLEEGTDDDNDVIKNIEIAVGDVEPGTYFIVVSAFYDYTVLDDKQTVELVVECDVEEEEEVVEVEEEEEEEESELIITSEMVKSIEKEPLRTEDYLIGLIIVAIVMIFVLISLLAVALYKK